jgi:hypothetical protein
MLNEVKGVTPGNISNYWTNKIVCKPRYSFLEVLIVRKAASESKDIHSKSAILVKQSHDRSI